MKLQTFFLSLYLFLITIVAGYFFFTFDQYKKNHAELTSQRSIATLYALRNSIIPIVDADQFNLIGPIIDSAPQHRSFIESLSFSLDRRNIHFSSDKKLNGHLLPKGTIINHDTIVSDILAGKTSFLLPITYFTDGQQQHGALFLKLNSKIISSSDFLTELYINFIFTSIIFSLLLGAIFFLIHWHLMRPLKAFGNLILYKKIENTFFLISDFSTLYNRLSDSYIELEENEKALEAALLSKNYLYDILHTMDLINRLLISEKSTSDIMTKSCELLAQHGHYRLAWIGNIVNENIDIIAYSDDPTGYVAQLNLSLNPNDLTFNGPSSQCILTNQTIIVQSINNQNFNPWRERAKDSGYKSLISLPLRGLVNEKPFGVLTIYSSKPFGFLPEEITMLEDLAGDIGYAVTSRSKKEELQVALTTDYLTGLFNRALLLERLHNFKTPQLILININRFRDINTVYGFDAGDFILRSCAECLRRFITNEQDEIFKLHSDTFAILLHESHPFASTELFLEKIAYHLSSHPFHYNDIEIWITITASYCDTSEQTIENAEITLKRAKEEKKLYLPFSPSMRLNKEHEENIIWYKIIKDAIAEGRVVPYYQEIINNQTGDTGKYEALIRIILPDGIVVSPFKFLDIAKKTGLYLELTKTMVTKTIEKFQNIPYIVSLNLSTEDIVSVDMVSFLHNAISQSGIGQKIVFEILESEGIDNYEQVSEFINEFKILGCQFAIDDFGSGFSNFEHLIKLQVDFLKIDGSLIKNLPHDKNAQVIVKNIQNFAAELGIKTIAEFVSSREIYEIVNAMGITYSQGYYFSEPMRELF